MDGDDAQHRSQAAALYDGGVMGNRLPMPKATCGMMVVGVVAENARRFCPSTRQGFYWHWDAGYGYSDALNHGGRPYWRDGKAPWAVELAFATEREVWGGF